MLALPRNADAARKLGQALAPASALALMRELTLEVAVKGTERGVLEELAASSGATSVRSITLHYLEADTGELEGALLAPFTRLERLRVLATGLSIRYASCFAALDSLEIEPLDDDTPKLFAPGHFAGLRSLALDVAHVALPLEGALAPLLEGTCAPRLGSLRVRRHEVDAVVAFLDALAKSPLAGRLVTLSCDGRECPRELLPDGGRAFSVLTKLELPARIADLLRARTRSS